MAQVEPKRAGAPVILIGSALVVVGITILALRQAGVDIGSMFDAGSWPLLIVVPGVVLLLSSFLVAPERGLAFAIPGAVVTTVGLILAYQQTTDHWESWAYVWALIPTAVGLAMAVYGTTRGVRDIVPVGLRLAAVGAVVSVVGWWFFESIFESGRAPIDLGGWWPAILIGIGVLMVGAALLRPTNEHRPA
jgi:hypothetical protein